jgi:hypothetical protein
MSSKDTPERFKQSQRDDSLEKKEADKQRESKSELTEKKKLRSGSRKRRRKWASN